MKNVRLAVVLVVNCLFAGVCLGQNRNNFGRAVIGAFGGLGDTPQKTAPDFAGGTWAAGTHSFGYSISYRQQLRRLLSGSFTYLNQGHYDRHGFLTDRHSRDDAQFELFLAQRPRGDRVEFHVGGGPAYYSETDKAGDQDFRNHQGFGLVLSGMVDIDITDRLFVELRAHRHIVMNRYPSTNALLGVGYRWHREENALALALVNDTREHFIRINYGIGTLNSRKSESLRDSFQVSHEIDLSKHFGTSASFLREGKAAELNRTGFAFQGIAKQEVGDAVTFGLALGPYINADRSDFFQRRNKVSVDALFTAFLDFRVTKRLELSVSTSRPRSLTTLQNKPMTDVYHAGLKFRLPAFE